MFISALTVGKEQELPELGESPHAIRVNCMRYIEDNAGKVFAGNTLEKWIGTCKSVRYKTCFRKIRSHPALYMPRGIVT